MIDIRDLRTNRERIAARLEDRGPDQISLVERKAARRHLEEHDAEGVDVRGRGDALATQLLGRHVGQRARESDLFERARLIDGDSRGIETGETEVRDDGTGSVGRRDQYHVSALEVG